MLTATRDTATTNRDGRSDSKGNPFRDQSPFGFEAGDANLYRYVSNNPVSGMDPSGLVNGVRHHPYPLYLGGSNEQPAFIVRSIADHNAAHNYLAEAGFPLQTPEVSARAWARLTRARQRELIIGSMRAAGIPASLIEEHIEVIMSTATPGTAVARAAGYPGGLIRVGARRGVLHVGVFLRGLRFLAFNPYSLAIQEVLLDPTPAAGAAHIPFETPITPPDSPQAYFLPRGTYILPNGQIWVPLPAAEYGESDYVPPPGSQVVVQSNRVLGQGVRPGRTYPPGSVVPVSPLAMLLPVGMTEDQARAQYAQYIYEGTGNGAGITPTFVQWLRHRYPNPERPR